VTSLYGAWVSQESSADLRALCSARGCRAAATFDLTWRNPRIHQGGRVKHWFACAEHADRLSDFLASRGFLLSRDPR
jgi:hypothetical protein